MSEFNDSALLARLPGTSAYVLTLAEAELRTPSMRRLVFTGADGLMSAPGQDLMLAIPSPDGSYRRRYSIRRQGDGTVTIDIVLHGDGPGARWASAAAPGDTVDAIGPRGSIVPVPGAAWHLFCGDESALPATLSMIESLPAGVRALCFLEVGGTEDEQVPDVVACDLDLQFLHRSGAPGTGTTLADACTALALPEGPGHAYLNGELRQVAAARSVLSAKGMAPDAVDHKSYWRLGVANAAHGEPARPES
jgi:NADPH-dependent ferric siderophore reductase